jgi:uncharacterized protein with HEPN domain
MSKRTSDLYTEDILISIRSIKKYAKDLSFEEFAKNQMKIDAVVRNFEIMGEAIKPLAKMAQEEHPEIPWKKIIGLRNKITHEYFAIELEIIWKVIKNDLDDLRKNVKRVPSFTVMD